MNRLEARNRLNQFNSPSVAMTAAKIIIPTGCTLNFPIGYLYMFTSFIARWVNQSMPPAMRSSRESKVDAAIAIDPLLMVA